MVPYFSILIFLILFYVFYKRNAMSSNMAIMLILLVISLIYIVYMFANRKYNPHHIAKGKEFAKNKKVIMATCLRDAQCSIDSIELLYIKFCNIFKEVKVVVLENNSKDKTRARLLELKKNKIPNMDLIGCGIDQDSCTLKLNSVRKGWSPDRTRRMAKIRNILLDHIKSIQKDYDFCFMFDDVEIEEFENEGIYDTMYHFENDKTIDAIASNTYLMNHDAYNKIYDPFAFKPIKGNRLSCWFFHFNKNGLIKVKSAYNGFMFYRLPFSDEIKYDENTNTCEHIDFNEQLNNVYLNQNFVVEISHLETRSCS